MPGPFDALKAIGNYLLPGNTPEEDAAQTAAATAAQANDPSFTGGWRGTANAAVGGLVNTVKNQLGLTPEAAARRADPVGHLTDNPMALITAYKTPEARMVGTDVFRKMVNDLPNSRLQQAGQEFADAYPRIAAHMEPMTGDPSGVAEGYINTPPGQVKYPMRTVITPAGVAKTSEPLLGPSLYTARAIMHHEGAHAAQALGNKDFNSLYSRANDVVGYDKNPFEQTARWAGMKATESPVLGEPVKGGWSGVDSIWGTPRPPNAITQLQDLSGPTFREQQDAISYDLQQHGISLDYSHPGGARQPDYKFRKWGSDAADPSNYLTPDQLPQPIQQALEKLKNFTDTRWQTSAGDPYFDHPQSAGPRSAIRDILQRRRDIPLQPPE